MKRRANEEIRFDISHTSFCVYFFGTSATRVLKSLFSSLHR